MSFKSYRNSRSKFRRVNRNDMSAQAEPCELRALLSASGITVSMAEASPCDAAEAEASPALDESTADIGADEKVTAVGDVNWDCLLACDGFMAPEGEVPEDDVFEGDAPEGEMVPLRYLMRGFGAIAESGIADDSTPVETFGPEEEVFVQDFVTEEGTPSEEWDPSWAYASFAPFDGVDSDETLIEEVSTDGTENPDESEVGIYHSLKPDATDETVTDENVVDDELVALEDAPPVDGWDPSWLYRSFTASPDGAADEGIKDDAFMEDGVLEDGEPLEEVVYLEDAPPVDGWDQSWLYRTLDSPVEEQVDSGEGLPDDFVVEPVESEGTFDPRILMTFGGSVDGPEGSGIEFAEGESKEITDPVDPGIEQEVYLYPAEDVITLEDLESPVFDGDDSSVPQIRFLSAAGGSEVQRTLTSSSAPTLEFPAATAAAAPEALPINAASSATAPVSQPSIATNVVPARQTSPDSLFNSSRGKSAVGVALTSPSGSGTVGSPSGTKSSPAPKRAKSQLQSIVRNSEETTELESLSPLTGGDAESPEVDAAPVEQNLPADEHVTPEPNAVGRREDVESGARVVVQTNRPSRSIRPGMIDEVMSQYAENSYNA